MRIALVTHYYPPEIGAPQARLSDLARMWQASGHQVTVVTGMPNHPTGVVPAQYRRRLRVRETLDGVRLIRCWLYATPNEGIIKKTLGHLSFMVSSVFLAVRPMGKVDVVVVSSPTFFSIGSAWLLSKLKRAKLVVEVRDLWPAIFVDLGVLRNKQIIWALERLELAAYRSAEAVVVVSEGFRDHIKSRGIPESKIHTIRNGVDVSKFSPAHQRSELIRGELGAGETDVLVLYIGAHGISQGLSSVVRAANGAAPGLHFALVGEGADKAAVESCVRELQVKNVTMLPGVPRERVADFLAAADICLVPLRNIPLFDTFIPSKMFELMAAGRPIVGAVRGEAAEILGAAGAAVVEPEDSDALRAAIEDIAFDTPRLREMSTRGRAFVEKNFDRSALATKYAQLLEEVTAC